MFNKFGIMVSALSLAVVAIVGCSYDKSAKSGSVKLRSPHGSAVVSLDGARILSWKDASGRELFFMPAKPYSPDGDWSHGGTSICWPWFGRKGNAQNMIHGFARNRAFSLRDRRTVPGGESVVLGLKVLKTDSMEFPYCADLELSITLTDRLSMKMKTTNLGTEPFEITEGFQSYFPVSDYGKIMFYGVDQEDFTAVNGMDKAFKRLAGVFGFKNLADGRGVRLNSNGNSGLVVWTPGTVEPANRNLAPDDCPKFIVLGPSSRAAEGSVSVKPGDSHELIYELSFL